MELLCNAFHLHYGFFFLCSVRLAFLSFGCVWGIQQSGRCVRRCGSYCGSAVLSLASRACCPQQQPPALHRCQNQCGALHFSVLPPHPFALLPRPHQCCRCTALIVALIKGKYLRHRHSRIFIRLSTAITDTEVA